jgi:hypothetical protein
MFSTGITKLYPKSLVPIFRSEYYRSPGSYLFPSFIAGEGISNYTVGKIRLFGWINPPAVDIIQFLRSGSLKAPQKTLALRLRYPKTWPLPLDVRDFCVVLKLSKALRFQRTTIFNRCLVCLA